MSYPNFDSSYWCGKAEPVGLVENPVTRPMINEEKGAAASAKLQKLYDAWAKLGRTTTGIKDLPPVPIPFEVISMDINGGLAKEDVPVFSAEQMYAYGRKSREMDPTYTYTWSSQPNPPTKISTNKVSAVPAIESALADAKPTVGTDSVEPPLTSKCTINAADILQQGVQEMMERASSRDTVETGERSMAKTVKSFNALTGRDLTESEGWLFMVFLKLARSVGGELRIDDYVDGAAYLALYGECDARTR